jgi:hypothetical protein
MQGEVLINDWKVALEGIGLDPKLGIGRALIGSDGLPVCLIWIHVDEIFLHGPARAKYTSALKKIFDRTVLVGLMCYPTDNKVVRALALLEFLIRGSRTVICHLAFAVVVGTLQSVVPATPTCQWGLFPTPYLPKYS